MPLLLSQVFLKHVGYLACEDECSRKACKQELRANWVPQQPLHAVSLSISHFSSSSVQSSTSETDPSDVIDSGSMSVWLWL